MLTSAQSKFNTSHSHKNNQTRITFVISIPSSTPDDSVIYIAGNFPDGRVWHADAFALEKSENGTYSGTIKLPPKFHFQYKITRGSWETVEKNDRGHEIPNREININQNKTITIAVQSWSDQLETVNNPGNKTPLKSTLTGNIKLHRSVHSKYLKRDRDVLVFVPPGYDDHHGEIEGANARRYPVLYMHDGRNVFDASTSFAGVEWGADETAQQLIAENKIEPIIIVAIDNTDLRTDEYTPTKDAAYGGGQGNNYAKFIINELKPFIDRTYRTLPDREHTGVAGSSLGGLISLYLVWNYPDTFSRAAVISPSLFWNHQHLIHAIEAEADPRWKNVRIWIDIGTKEGGESYQFDTTFDVKRLGAALASKGLEHDTNYLITIIEGGEHNESAWAQRFNRILLYLYGSK